MPKRKGNPLAVVIPKEEPFEYDEPPTGNAREFDAFPWDTYDKFIRGDSIRELSISTADEKNIVAAINEMRDEMRKSNPGVTDEEADAIRFEDLTIRAALADGSPPSLKISADAHVRRRKIRAFAAQRLAQDRNK